MDDIDTTTATPIVLQKLCKLAPFANWSFGKVPKANAEIGMNVSMTPIPKRIFGNDTYQNDTARFIFVYKNVESPRKKNPIDINNLLS